ncbi:MAG: CHAP domain-containing protein [Saprospiraceae bacterium]|nr:CHAP domain-containing protein [Saprospiraceae bacterium]
MRILRYFLSYIVVLVACSAPVFGQTYSANPTIGTWVCPSTTMSGTCGTHVSNITKGKISSISGTTAVFELRKCNNTVFSVAGTFYVKTGGVCGTVVASGAYSAGASYKQLSASLSGIPVGGSKTFYLVVVSSDGSRLWAGSFTISRPQTASITVNPTSLSAAATGGQYTVSVASTVTWTATDNASWITLSPTSGAANSTTALNVNIAANTNPGARSGTITISGGGITKTITVSQSAFYLTVSPTTLSYSAAAGSQSAVVATNLPTVAVTDNRTWIMATKSGNTITVQVLANTEPGTRSGTVTASGTGVVTTIAVSQAAGSTGTCSFPNGYPYNGACSGADPYNFIKGNCTSYVAYMMNRDNTTTSGNYVFYNAMTTPALSHAKYWDEKLAALGYVVSSTPVPGCIAHWDAGEWLGNGCPNSCGNAATAYGHVAYVESVNPDGTVNISEYNVLGTCGFTSRCNVTAPRYIRFSRFKQIASLGLSVNPVATGYPLTITATILNNHTQSVTSNFRAAIYSNTNQYLGTLAQKNNEYFGANASRTLSFYAPNVSFAPGSYKIWIESSTTTNASRWILISAPVGSNPLAFNIVAAAGGPSEGPAETIAGATPTMDRSGDTTPALSHQDALLSEEFVLFPNPLSGTPLQARCQLGMAGTLEFRVFDASGKAVASVQHQLLPGEQVVTVLEQALPLGSYTVQGRFPSGKTHTQALEVLNR